jgi:signal transduction histidine kinase
VISFFSKHLFVRLFLSYLLVILVVGVILALVTRFTVPQAFNRHMGDGLGQGNGMGQGMMADLFQNFQASFYQALFLALGAAGVVAVVVSLLLSRGVSAPVGRLKDASHRLAEGHYSERIGKTGEDELGQLAGSFNRMAEKLEQTEEMRKQLIADVSHELRTPLTAIKGSMEGLMDGVLPAEAATYQQIHQEADRLSRLVDDLQELSQVEAGVMKLELSQVDIKELVRTTLNRLASQAASKEISLLDEVSSSMPRVKADARRITQVLTNLVANAIQYTPKGGTVTVTAEQSGDKVSVKVSDTGIGIPAEHIPHLFTRFYRVEKSRSRQAGGGSGIGLAIARHLVEAHGGTIRAESGGSGKGSKFTFTLPLVAN